MSVADRLPSDIVDAVGPAPAVERPRWIALAAASPDTGWSGRLIRCWKAKTFVTPPDRRFQVLHDHLTQTDVRATRRAKPSPGSRSRGRGWPPSLSSISVSCSRSTGPSRRIRPIPDRPDGRALRGLQGRPSAEGSLPPLDAALAGEEAWKQGNRQDPTRRQWLPLI
jgi:hypothetical protein